MLGDTGEALGLVANVPHKVPHRLRVHLLVLQDGVGQQADGGQRGLQLVGGVRDKAAADLLRGLETVGELVEFLGQMGQFVLARGLETVAVLPFTHDADGAQQSADAGGEHFGK